MDSKNAFAVVGEDISKSCRRALTNLGFDLCILPQYERLSRAVASHADLLIFPYPDSKKIFTYAEYREINRSLFDGIAACGWSIETIDELPEREYPSDICLNMLVLGKRVFAKKKSISEKISEMLTVDGFELINVNQGYARCTACPIGDGALVSADNSILSAAKNCGIDVLAIGGGNIKIRDYDYGFIGGCCGFFEDKIYFSGNIDLHPDGRAIKEFCIRHGKTPVSLSDEPLIDVGSIFFLGK